MTGFESIVREIDKAATGRELHKLRVSLKLTTEDVCDLMGLESPRAIYKWESGQTLPSTKHLLALCGYYHVSLESILRCEEGEADASPIAFITHFIFLIIRRKLS